MHRHQKTRDHTLGEEKREGMTIDINDMTSALYTQDIRSLDEDDRVTLWTHVNTIVADLTDSSSERRHADAMRLVSTLRFQDMSDDVRLLFRIALGRMPQAQRNMPNDQLEAIMSAETPTSTLTIRENPHGLAMCYHEMNVQV